MVEIYKPRIWASKEAYTHILEAIPERGMILPVAWSESDTWKAERTSDVKVERHGRLDECAGGVYGAWTGSVSLERRLSTRNPDDQIDSEAVDAALENIGAYYRKASPTASIRCADGRELDGWQPEMPLGPQVFAASTGSAIGMHVIEPFRRSGKDFEEDLAETFKRFDEIGVPCGGHDDDKHHTDAECSGCAGVDNIKDIFLRLCDERFEEQILNLAQGILGEDYDERVAQKVLEKSRYLRKSEKTYFKKGLGRRVLQRIRKRANGFIQTLKGAHREVAVVFNTVEGETFDNTRFSMDHGGKIQAFNCDVWEFKILAEQIYSKQEYPINAERLRLQKEYVMFRLFFAIASAMVITDGSLEVVTRRR